AADEEAPAVRVSYARDIQPILADNCLTCHGLDASSRQADLRLDTQQGQLDSGAVVPGQPDESLLIARIESDDPEMLMPPPSSKRTLTPQQKQLLRDWIEQGAVVEGHWAFQAPTRPSIPDVRQQD